LVSETENSLTAQKVLVTSGRQAALSAVFRHLCAPGDPVIVESLTYLGALAAARPPRRGPAVPPAGIRTTSMGIRCCNNDSRCPSTSFAASLWARLQAQDSAPGSSRRVAAD
jgi:hypothetical protein